jgi:excisionase family DNA binding protein
MYTGPLNHTVDQACERLGISRTTLYDLFKTGGLKFIKIGARTLVPESEIQALQGRLIKSASETAKAA